MSDRKKVKRLGLRKQHDLEPIHMTRADLRPLVFWAAVGVRYSKGGSYGDIVEEAILRAAEKLNWTLYQFPYPEFGAQTRKKP